MTRDELLRLLREQVRDATRDAVHDGLAALREDFRALAKEILAELVTSEEGCALLAEACREEFSRHGRAALSQLLKRTNN